jgi:thiol-disulfide isomerase/thioredoxin
MTHIEAIEPERSHAPAIIENTLPMHQIYTVKDSTIFIQEQSNGFIFPQFENQIVLLQIFGKECEYCFEEMPFIQHMSNKYSGSVQIVALQAQNKMTMSETNRILQNFNINYPIIDRDEGQGLLRFINKTYGWNGILPYFLLIKDGVTEYSFSGKIDKKEFEDAIRDLL